MSPLNESAFADAFGDTGDCPECPHIHTTTNDRDVNVIEVEHLIAQLKAAGKEFQCRIYKDAPGGHSFNRTDTTLARESRNEIYAFLAKYLK